MSEPITTYKGRRILFNNGVVDVVQGETSLVDENKVAHIPEGGNVEIDNLTIIKNADDELEVPFDNNTIYRDSEDGFIKAAKPSDHKVILCTKVGDDPAGPVGSFTLNQNSDKTITIPIPQGGGSTYTAGDGIQISNDEISVKKDEFISRSISFPGMSWELHFDEPISGLGSFERFVDVDQEFADNWMNYWFLDSTSPLTISNLWGPSGVLIFDLQRDVESEEIQYCYIWDGWCDYHLKLDTSIEDHPRLKFFGNITYTEVDPYTINGFDIDVGQLYSWRGGPQGHGFLKQNYNEVKLADRIDIDTDSNLSAISPIRLHSNSSIQLDYDTNTLGVNGSGLYVKNSGSSYTAGTGISISDNTISIDLAAGEGISISDNIISTTSGIPSFTVNNIGQVLSVQCYVDYISDKPAMDFDSNGDGTLDFVDLSSLPISGSSDEYNLTIRIIYSGGSNEMSLIMLCNNDGTRITDETGDFIVNTDGSIHFASLAGSTSINVTINYIHDPYLRWVNK